MFGGKLRQEHQELQARLAQTDQEIAALRNNLSRLESERNEVRAELEGIHPGAVGGAVDGKSFSGAGCPYQTCRRSFGITRGKRIIIDDHLVGLRVTFPRDKHVRTRVLEHGDEIGQDERGRDQILHGEEEPRSLPFPAIDLVVVVPAVTVPETDVPVE